VALFRGWGILVIILPVAAILVGFAFDEHNRDLVAAVGCFATGVIMWFIGRWLNGRIEPDGEYRPKGIEKIFENGFVGLVKNMEFKEALFGRRRGHSLFWVKLELWCIFGFLLGGLFLLVEPFDRGWF